MHEEKSQWKYKIQELSLTKYFGKLITYKMTFQLDLNFRTRDLKPLDGVNNSPLDALKMMVLLCCSALSAPASC